MRCATLSSLRRGLRRGRLALGAEDGGLLIEVMVSAVVVVLLALGVFKALDTASATSGAIKGRAIAANLAQADLERMRGMKVSDLSNRRESYDRQSAGLSFTVTSKADWVTDSSGTASCSSDNSRADYIKISSTVTSPTLGGIKPVVLTSIVAAPVGSFKSNQGSLAVKVTDAAGNAVVGKQVTLSGPQGYTDVTNELGCVLWGFLGAANYSVTLSAGCTDRLGNSPVTKPASVIGEAVTTIELDCDVAGSIRASFDTEMWDLASNSWKIKPSKGKYLAAANSGLPAPFLRAFGDGSDRSEIVASGLFPFSEPYALYAGNCTNADPRIAPNNGSAVMQAAPSGGTAGPVTVREPAINVQVVKSGGAAVSGARVKAYTKTAGCTGTFVLGDPGAGTGTNAQGQLTDPGVPYGLYDVCADYNGRGRSATLTGLQAYVPKGTSSTASPPFLKLQVATDGSGTACP